MVLDTWGAGSGMDSATQKPINIDPGFSQPADVTEGMDKKFKTIWDRAKEEYGYIDSIFATDPELKKLLTKAMTEKWTESRFEKAFSGTTWFIKNANSIQARGFYQRQYEDLIAKIAPNDPQRREKIKAAAGDSEYARGLDTTMAALERSLTTKGISYSPAQLEQWSKEIYNSANEKNTSFIDRFLNQKLSWAPGDEKGKVADYASDLRDYANDQGFDFDKDFGTNRVNSWMQRLDKGESLAAIKKEIETQAMIGQPESVKSLMRQGLTVKNIYDPYVTRFTSKLQKPGSTMKDPWIQSNMFNEKGELRSQWEFDIAMKQHPDWAFSDEGHQQIGDITLKILRDFGLQG